jgi:acetyltransferase-like isoleucine patch superfamily enzyme
MAADLGGWVLGTHTFLLPVVRIGERLRIPRSAVDRLIAGDVPARAEEPVSLVGR